MDWIKIEPGCEMPEEWDRVIVAHVSHDGHRGIASGTYCVGKFCADSDRIELSDYEYDENPTHWARVELPNNSEG